MLQKQSDTTKKYARKPSQRPASEGLEGISFYLSRAYYRYIALVDSALREVGVADRVRPGMGHVLFALFEEDDRLIKEIVERADVSPSTLTGILKQMEKHGLVKRRTDENDGRAVRVRLTRLAKSMEKRLRRAEGLVRNVLHADLSPDELQVVKQALARMTHSMGEHETRRQQSKRSSDQ